MLFAGKIQLAATDLGTAPKGLEGRALSLFLLGNVSIASDRSVAVALKVLRDSVAGHHY